MACARPLRRGGPGNPALISALVVFAIEVVSLFFARSLFVWFYNRTGFSVLLVVIFHASFDAAINQLSYDVVPASNTARFLIFSAVIVLFATVVIIVTKGRLGTQERSTPCRTPETTTDRAAMESACFGYGRHSSCVGNRFQASSRATIRNAADAAGEHTPDDAAGRESDPRVRSRAP
jgi:hypothetical protein